MGFWEVFLIAVGLSMDAFAVSVGKGLATPKYEPKGSLICGLWFGGFQMLMPLIGCFLGTQFAGYIESIDHWIAFVLLALIGGNMIREAARRGRGGRGQLVCAAAYVAARGGDRD